MTTLPSDSIRANIARVQDEMAAAAARAGRAASAVTLVAVSKKKSPAAIVAAVEAGLQHFGENRVEESQVKIPEVSALLSAPVTWHMVGHIQSRKARFIPDLYQVVHSVDSLKLAEKLSELMQGRPALEVLIQVNVSGEEQKSGFEATGWQQDPSVREPLIEAFAQLTQLPGLNVRGLMTMAPIVDDMQAARPVFASLAALRDTLAQELKVPLPDLSMGMTDDYPVAIEEGATLVRVGRAIFGERNSG